MEKTNRSKNEKKQTCKTDRYESLKLSNQVCFPLYACSKELINQYNPFLKPLGLTYTQYIVMMVMWEKETVSSRELAESLHLDYGTLTPVLKRLEKAGYLTRNRDPKDERLLFIAITEEGKKIKDAAVKIPPCIARNMGLGEDEFKMLYTLTYKALANMENASDC